MGTEIVQFVEQAGPYLSAALGAYGAGVLARAEDAAVGATANAGRSILHAVWRRRSAAGRPELEAAVREAAEEPGDADAAAALRQQIKRALREDPQLLAELAAQLPAAGSVTITASGERSIAAQTIGTAVTGDNATIQP
ncbi:hypothetical protein ACFQ6B_06210 [Streptomyces wedmorensis]|uniref:Uncharacterized protein n=1 Tax=Streptomyces wedmorensis TaxID=43759 RepID=A0ABW6IZH7_STRWE